METPTASPRYVGRRDDCACNCYPNGILPLLLSQILFIVAVAMSAVSMLDCKFVIADILPGDQLPDTLVGLIGLNRTGLGFFIHEEADGDCRWEYWGSTSEDVDGDEIEDYIEDYIDWLGDDWKPGRGLGSTALVAGFCFWVWALVFACVAHVKVLRYIMGVTVALIFMSFQFATFSVLHSDFCDDHDCSFGRSAGYSVAAGVLFFLAGFFFFLTKDYPGDEAIQEERAVSAVHPKKAEEDVQPEPDDTHIEDDHVHAAEEVPPVNPEDGGAQEVKAERAFTGGEEDVVPTMVEA